MIIRAHVMSNQCGNQSNSKVFTAFVLHLYKVHNGLAPHCVTDMFSVQTYSRCLRSEGVLRFVFPEHFIKSSYIVFMHRRNETVQLLILSLVQQEPNYLNYMYFCTVLSAQQSSQLYLFNTFKRHQVSDKLLNKGTMQSK